jgi:serine protease Do
MQKQINWHLSLILILAAALGFFAGIVGYSVIGWWDNDIPFVGEISFVDTGLDRNIFIDRPRSVVVKQDLNIRQVQNAVLSSLINVYSSNSLTRAVDMAYLPGDILAQGVVLTNDGWSVVSASGISNLLAEYSAVGYQNNQYQLTNFINDPATGLMFGRMDQADNLPVAELGRSSELNIGQGVVVVSERNKIFLARIIKIGNDFQNKTEIVQSSDELNKRIFIDIGLDDSFEGAVVANLKGEVVGIVADGMIVPVDYFQSVIGQILEDQEISRASMGVNYIDLSQVEGLVTIGERGALVYGHPLVASSAYRKVKSDDIIVKVNDEEVGVYSSLSELLLKYRSGQEIELLVLRHGQEMKISIILK